MRIQDTYTSGALPPQTGKTGQAEAVTPGAENKQAASRAAGQEDQVHLSELSGRLLRIASTQSPERAARLERLGADVRAGRYQVDAMRVSRALIEEVLKGG
jgi:flagellar biosynthesis anti-sigma factor FlgM